MAGGGPVVGYGERGFVYGGELAGGFTFANVSLGAQRTDQTIAYATVSGDAALGGSSLLRLNGDSGYARTGAGIGLSTTTGRDGQDTFHPHGVAVMGLGIPLPVPAHASGCASSRFVETTLELRYVGGWELVLVPRVEVAAYPCSY